MQNLDESIDNGELTIAPDEDTVCDTVNTNERATSQHRYYIKLLVQTTEPLFKGDTMLL
jgi:hypothetical protein